MDKNLLKRKHEMPGGQSMFCPTAKEDLWPGLGMIKIMHAKARKNPEGILSISPVLADEIGLRRDKWKNVIQP